MRSLSNVRTRSLQMLAGLAIMLILSVVSVRPVYAADIFVDNLDGSCVIGSGQPDPYSVVYCTIQDAIDDASPGDTIHVAAGTYVEDLLIPESLTGLELNGAGAGVTVVKGIAHVPSSNWPLVMPNVEVLADGVSIQDFNFQGPDPAPGYYSSGMVIGGANVEVMFNFFDVPNASSLDDISQGLQTYSGATNPTTGAEVDGLVVQFNDFRDLGVGTFGIEGIYINADTGDPTPGGAVTVASNLFSGDIARAITTERSNTSINNNNIASDLPVGDLLSSMNPSAYQGINVPAAQDIAFYGNTITGFWQQVNGSGGSLDYSNLVASNFLDHSVYSTAGDAIYWYIQDAIDAATPGDTLEIGAATYVENITIDKTLDLNGEDKTTTIIDGGGVDRVVYVGGMHTVSLNGLTIENGSADQGGGIYNLGALTLSETVVENNEATDFGGGIFHASLTDTLTIEHSDILMNDATDPASDGGGIYSEGPISITNSTIDGNSAGDEGGGVGLSGASSSLHMTQSTVSSNSVTAQNSAGGGISSSVGNLTIIDGTISGNTATATGGDGGGISSTGDVSLQYSTVSGNSADDSGGGLIQWSGRLSLDHSAVRDNFVVDNFGFGGGIYALIGSVELSEVEVSGNTSPNSGGGMHSLTETTIVNSTFSGNSAIFGGAFDLLSTDPDPSSLINSTITSNTNPVGGGVGGINVSSALEIRNTIIAGNDGAQCMDVSGSDITSLGNNIEDADTCGFQAAGDQTNTDPRLGPLADNGGETQTHMLLAGSPAIDGGTNTDCPDTDQRDVGRPIEGDGVGLALCDVGAVEAVITIFLPLIMR